MGQTRYDFIVIGAGPAGCAAAAPRAWQAGHISGRRDTPLVMPAITSAHTNAPSKMIGHRAGAIIAADAA